jgi:hypothetical protein
MCDFKAKAECFKFKTNKTGTKTGKGGMSEQFITVKMSLLYGSSPFLFSLLIESSESLSFLIHDCLL